MPKAAGQHPLLTRQLRRAGLVVDAPPPGEKEWRDLLERISASYETADQERYLLERSLEISSREMQSLYDDLRRASEGQISHERDRLRAVISSIGAGLCVVDAGLRVQSANPEAERLLGWSGAEMQGRHLLEFLVAPAAPDLGDTSGAHDAMCRRRDRPPIPVSYTLSPVLEGGTPAGAVFVFLDLTARREAEMERDRFFALSNDLLCIAGFDGYFKRLNTAWERMLGTPVAELYESPWLSFVHPDDRQATADAAERGIRNGVLEGFEHRFRCRDGSYRRLQWMAVTYAESELFYAVARDVTEERREGEEMRLAKEAAESAARAKADFLANISHEIRTPLNAIIGMTGLLLETPLVADQREFASTIRTSSEALLALVNDVLDFSKIDSGRMDLESRPFDPRTCLEEATALVAGAAAAKGIRLSAAVDDPVPALVVGDPERVRQVLINLLTNAVKFTDFGEVAARLRARPLEGRSWEIEFAVRDTGIGIPAARMGRLFQSFSQVDTSTTRRYGGTGLGLAISKRLSDLMSGELDVESQEATGSTFRFRFPAAIGEAPGPASGRAAAPNAADSPAGGVGGRLGDRFPVRILLAEDYTVNRRVALLMLSRLGLDADVAEDGEEVLRALAIASYDVILMDVQMPRLNGLDATRALRGRDPRDGPVVVAMTANAQLEDRQTCLDAGMDDYVSKPLRLERLQEVLESWCPEAMARRARRVARPASGGPSAAKT